MQVMYDDATATDHATCCRAGCRHHVTTNVNCFGGTTGPATVTATGGTAPTLKLEYDTGGDRGYRFWSCRGTYTVTITDCGRMHDDCYGYDHAARCGSYCQHHGYYECELLWRTTAQLP